MGRRSRGGGLSSRGVRRRGPWEQPLAGARGSGRLPPTRREGRVGSKSIPVDRKWSFCRVGLGLLTEQGWNWPVGREKSCKSQQARLITAWDVKEKRRTGSFCRSVVRRDIGGYLPDLLRTWRRGNARKSFLFFGANIKNINKTSYQNVRGKAVVDFVAPFLCI